MKCPKCKETIPPETKTCPNCSPLFSTIKIGFFSFFMVAGGLTTLRMNFGSQISLGGAIGRAVIMTLPLVLLPFSMFAMYLCNQGT
ncbi:MAG: hypothetical protein ACI86H_002347 [bacterium]|jgi:hypothetical protein